MKMGRGLPVTRFQLLLVIEVRRQCMVGHVPYLFGEIKMAYTLLLTHCVTWYHRVIEIERER